jgi:hypothetical protein
VGDAACDTRARFRGGISTLGFGDVKDSEKYERAQDSGGTCFILAHMDKLQTSLLSFQYLTTFVNLASP